MAYSNFTLDTAREAFNLEEIGTAGIFADCEPLVPSDLLHCHFGAKNTISYGYRDRESKIRNDCRRCARRTPRAIRP